VNRSTYVLSSSPPKQLGDVCHNNFFEEDAMRVTHVLCLLTALFSVPAVAADVDAKQEAQKIASAYAENFNRQNAAGIAALYANGGMAVNPTGLHTDIAQIYEGAFKLALITMK